MAAECTYDPGGWGNPPEGFSNGVDKIKIVKRTLLGDWITLQDPYGHQLEVSYEDFEVKRRDCQYSEKYPDWIFPKKLREETPSQAAAIAPRHAAQPFNAADLNGDGLTDVATVRFNRGASLTLGTGENRWDTGTTYDTGEGPEELLLADLNGDGAPEMLVADQGDFSQEPGALNVFPGMPNGAFAAVKKIVVGQGPRAGGWAGGGIGDPREGERRADRRKRRGGERLGRDRAQSDRPR